MCFNPVKKKAISLVLVLILRLGSSSMSAIKRSWEEDLKICITEADWGNVLSNIHSSSMCARHCLLQFKIVHRVQQIKIDKDVSSD